MFGKVGGVTNTVGWSSLFSFCGSSGLETTSISIATFSLSFCAIVMSCSCEETSSVSSRFAQMLVHN
ncbi:hypothetical protein Syun_026047 [Stephania yunnanensis]|uniref:Uncharacterized protein n=1 Tax=Stephania yunnanensis TaxID=152371 RepID=A0AAP0EY64_9MAGN